jgi:ketosteroid isomerase-like protein
MSGIAAYAADANQAVADEVIAVTKAQWAAGRAKNMAEAGKNIADDYTEFNGDAATRIEGKALSGRIEEANSKDPGVELLSEMLNPKVQVYGDTAILSYNFLGITQGKDGKVASNRAKSTRIYVKQGGKWMLVHANFQPDPKPSN